MEHRNMGDSHLLVDILKQLLQPELAISQFLGVEVGVYRGDLSLKLLEAFPKLILHLVDVWEPSDSESEYVKSGDACGSLSFEEHTDNYKHVVGMFKWTRRVFIHKKRSVVAANILLDRSMQFVYLDADHTLAAITKDINTWWPKVKPGGILCGHDYTTEENQTGKFGVEKAVKQFAKDTSLTVNLLGSNWWIRKP